MDTSFVVCVELTGLLEVVADVRPAGDRVNCVIHPLQQHIRLRKCWEAIKPDVKPIYTAIECHLGPLSVRRSDP